MKNARFFDASGTPLAWRNICDNVVEMYDAIEDATNAKELVDGVNSVNYLLTFHVDKETKEYVRLVSHDWLENVRYIKAWF